MGYKSKYKGSEIDSLLDKAKNDYTVKQYADYAWYNADTSRPSNTISLIQQDQSVVVGGKRYSQNAECYVGSNTSGISTTGNWFLAGEATITNARDVNVVGIVQHAITSGTCGIFALGLRGYSESASKFNFSWLCKTGGTVPLLRVVINGHTVKLYCKVYGGQYQYAHIRLLDQCNQYEANNYKTSFFTLADSTTIIPEADVPSGTDIADVPYLLKTGNAASATKATQDGNGVVIAGNYQRVYKSSFHVTADGWYKLAFRPNTMGLLDWKDKYILVNVYSRQGGPCNASFKILYSSQGGSMSTLNNEFLCIPLTTTNYACISNVRLLSKTTGVSGNSYIELYVQLSKGGDIASTDVEISIESNIPNTYLYNTATAGEIDTSAYTVIKRNAVTGGYGGSLAVGGLVAEKSLSANNVKQTPSVGNYQCRVLLGGNIDSEEYAGVYKSAKLFYNPSTETLTVPTIKNPNSSWVHTAEGVAGQSGYVKVATIKINTVYTDQPLTIQFAGRNYLQPAKIYICFYSENNTDPTLASFYYESGSTRFGEYLHKSATGTWDLYIKKGQSWDKIIILSCENPYAFLSPNPNYSITWQDELVTTLPTDYVESIMSTKRIHISGNANSANKLATPRSFNLGGGLTGTAVNFDGTGNVVLNGGLKKVFSKNANVHNYQYHRFLSIGSAETPLPATSQNYHFTFLVQNSETGSREGLLDINLRTNGSTQNSYLDCRWLLLSSYSSGAHPKIAYGFSDNATTAYADLFIVHAENYKNYHFVLLSFNLREAANVTSSTTYTLYNSSEVGNTTATDKLTSYEVYTSIAQAGQEIHGHTTDAGYSIVKDDTITDNMATAVNGFVNSAKTANKLQTSRKIGFADFNGTADVSLNKIQGASVTRWTLSGTLKPNQWIRFMRMKFSQTYSSVSITLAIEDIEQHRFRGLINFTAWVGSNLTTSVNNSTAIWYSLYQVDKNSFGDVTQYIRMVPIAPTDNDANGYVDVYVMSPLSAIQYGWHIINDRQTNNASFTLKTDGTTIIDNENFPTSYKSSAFQGVLATGENVEYSSWVTKATNATNADVANKTKYPIVFKRNGASITNWFANTTFVIDIPEELLDYSAPTGITLKVPEISVANKVANKLSLTVNGSTTEYDGSAGASVSIKANCTHIVKANSSNSLGTLYPEQTGHPSAVTVPISILPLEPYNSAARGLNDGDTLILHVPNAMSNPTANYVWCVKLDITKENATDNIIPLIHGQSAGTPAFWDTSTTIPAGFYQFVYSATLGGLVYMYRNTSTT